MAANPKHCEKGVWEEVAWREAGGSGEAGDTPKHSALPTNKTLKLAQA